MKAYNVIKKIKYVLHIITYLITAILWLYMKTKNCVKENKVNKLIKNLYQSLIFINLIFQIM